MVVLVTRPFRAVKTRGMQSFWIDSFIRAASRFLREPDLLVILLGKNDGQTANLFEGRSVFRQGIFLFSSFHDAFDMTQPVQRTS